MTYVLNKKVKFNYDILDTFEAGIELIGSEVKSIRNNKGNIDSAYIIVRGGEAFLMNADIPPFQTKNAGESYVPTRNRKILLTKKEIEKLSLAEEKQGLTIVPLSLYNKGVKIKIQIATVKGKKKIDKRETIQKRETDRDIRRTLKRQ